MIEYDRSKTESRTAICWHAARIRLGTASGVVLFRSLWATEKADNLIQEVAYVEE